MNKDKMEKIIKEAKDLLSIFEEHKTKIEINNNSRILKYIDRVTISKYIVPYLDIKDIINFRSTCKDINGAVSSTVALVSYYKAINNKSQNNDNSGNFNRFMLRPFNDLNDCDDIQIELDSVKKIKDFLTQKLFQSESIIKLYKNDLEYLKSELHSQNEVTERLTETLLQTREEFEDAKKLNLQLKQKLEDTNKKFDESNSYNSKKTDDLQKCIEDMKSEKTNLTNGILKLKKIAGDLNEKNTEKSEALKSIRNFFMTSTLFKIKNIADLEESYNKEKASVISTDIETTQNK